MGEQKYVQGGKDMKMDLYMYFQMLCELKQVTIIDLQDFKVLPIVKFVDSI